MGKANVASEAGRTTAGFPAPSVLSAILSADLAATANQFKA